MYKQQQSLFKGCLSHSTALVRNRTVVTMGMVEMESSHSVPIIAEEMRFEEPANPFNIMVT